MSSLSYMSGNSCPTEVLSTHLPKHAGKEGLLGAEIEFTEWMESQMRIACLAILEMNRPPRVLSEDVDSTSIPRIEDEELAFHLLQVHKEGMYSVPESKKFIRNDLSTQSILDDWLEHFGPLFNIACKESQIAYEVEAYQLENFQWRLVEHIQHQRRIYEEHSYGIILDPSTVWLSMEWGAPHILSEEGISFLRQTTYLPHVVGNGDDTQLLLDAIHNSRESLLTRLSPFASGVVTRTEQ